MKKRSLDEMLQGIDNQKPCKVERNEELAAELRKFYDMVEAGETHVSLQYIYLMPGGLRDTYDGPSMTTVRRWWQAETRRRAE